MGKDSRDPRLSIYADTSVWIKWLRTRLGRPESGIAEYQAFDKLLTRLVQVHADIWYSAALEKELIDPSQQAEFYRAVTVYKLLRGPVPLIRADGSYKADGSALCGGRWGGAGQEIRASEGDRDAEHFEAALEAGETWCLTLDARWKDIVRPALRPRIMLPSDALARFESMNSAPRGAPSC
jgi:hypothetical protein